MLDYSYQKFIKFIKEHPDKITSNDLEEKFKISGSESNKILNTLLDEKLLVRRSNYYVPTTKAKMYFVSDWYDFLKSNFIAILALVVSIASFIVSLIALIRTF